MLDFVDKAWGTGKSLPRVAPSVANDERFQQWWARLERLGASPGAGMALIRMNSGIDVRPVLSAVHVPTLVIHRANDTFIDFGRILVAQYVSDGRVLTGVGVERAADGRHAFYDPEGRSLRKSFLKSPLEFTRITSGFTWARPHPILGGVRPHLAIDYGAPTGTPVRAVADGRVGAAGWAGGNGISVTLKHRSGYETMYNHLSRLASGVRPGGRVTQRQVIGYVGATGLATGPHLDYRVSKNGQFVNPLGEKFIPGEPIAAAERGAFTAHARELVRRLEETAPF